jgi:MFS family permease
LDSSPSPRRVLIPLGIGTVISLLGDATLYTVLPNPTIAAGAGVTLAQVGILLGVNRAARLLTNGPVGILYDRLPRRALMVLSLIMGALSSVLYATGSGFFPLLLGRVLWGFAWSLLWIGGNTMVLDISTDETRGSYAGRYQMWFYIGVASASFCGGLFTDWLGFRGGLWLSTTLTALAAVMWLISLPETRPASYPSSDATSATTPLYEKPPFPWGAALAAAVPLFAMRFVFAGVLAATTILWVETLVGSRLSLLGIALPLATFTGTLSAARSGVSVVAAPLSGRLSDWLGRRWPIVAAVSLLGAAGLALMSLPIVAVAIAGIALAALTGGSIQSLAPAIIGDRVNRTQRGRAIGLIYILGDLGSTISPPLALGLLSSQATSIAVIYRGCAILFALVGIFALTRLSTEQRLASAP